MNLPQQLILQLKRMEHFVDPTSSAILLRHPNLRGIPALVVEDDGYTFEFMGSSLPCLVISDPAGMARLLGAN